jgi:hypothetical protein
MGPLCVGMMDVVTAQRDDFLVAMDRRFIIFMAMMPQKTLHKPRLGMVRINVENSIEKNLGDLPSFFGNCAGGVTTIHADHGVIIPIVVLDWRLEHCNSQHRCLIEI